MLQFAILLVKIVFFLICWRVSELVVDGRYSTECGIAAIIMTLTAVSTTAVHILSGNDSTGILRNMFGGITTRILIIVAGTVIAIQMVEMDRIAFAVWLFIFYVIVLIYDNLGLLKRLRNRNIFRRNFFEEQSS
jgi:hypothetical protein